MDFDLTDQFKTLDISSVSDELNLHGDRRLVHIPCLFPTTVSFHTAVSGRVWQLRLDGFVGHVRLIDLDTLELTLICRNESRNSVYYVVNTERGKWSYDELLHLLAHTRWGHGGLLPKEGNRDPSLRLKVVEKIPDTFRRSQLLAKINDDKHSSATVKEMQRWLLGAQLYDLKVRPGSSMWQIRFVYMPEGVGSGYPGVAEVNIVLKFGDSMCERVWCWVHYGEESEGFKEFTNISSLDALRVILTKTEWCDYALMDVHVPTTTV